MTQGPKDIFIGPRTPPGNRFRSSAHTDEQVDGGMRVMLVVEDRKNPIPPDRILWRGKVGQIAGRWDGTKETFRSRIAEAIGSQQIQPVPPPLPARPAARDPVHEKCKIFIWHRELHYFLTVRTSSKENWLTSKVKRAPISNDMQWEWIINRPEGGLLIQCPEEKVDIFVSPISTRVANSWPITKSTETDYEAIKQHYGKSIMAAVERGYKVYRENEALRHAFIDFKPKEIFERMESGTYRPLMTAQEIWDNMDYFPYLLADITFENPMFEARGEQTLKMWERQIKWPKPNQEEKEADSSTDSPTKLPISGSGIIDPRTEVFKANHGAHSIFIWHRELHFLLEVLYVQGKSDHLAIRNKRCWTWIKGYSGGGCLVECPEEKIDIFFTPLDYGVMKLWPMTHLTTPSPSQTQISEHFISSITNAIKRAYTLFHKYPSIKEATSERSHEVEFMILNDKYRTSLKLSDALEGMDYFPWFVRDHVFASPQREVVGVRQMKAWEESIMTCGGEDEGGKEKEDGGVEEVSDDKDKCPKEEDGV